MAGIGGQHPPEWWLTSAGIYTNINAFAEANLIDEQKERFKSDYLKSLISIIKEFNNEFPT
jgi:hypothetical protein